MSRAVVAILLLFLVVALAGMVLAAVYILPGLIPNPANTAPPASTAAGPPPSTRQLTDREREQIAAQVKQGGIYLREGQAHSALQEFSGALRRDPRNLEALCGAGDANERLDQRLDARKAYETALLVDPKCARARAGLGWVALGNKDPDTAQKEFERALADDPDNVAAKGGLGAVHLARKQVTEALPLLEKGYQAAPDHTGLARAYARALVTAKRPRDAVPVLSKLVAANPQDGVSYAALGEAHFLSGRPEDAITALTRATNLNARDAVTFSYLGAAESQVGQHPLAIAHLEQAADMAPKDPAIRLRLVAAYLAAKQLPKAEAAFKVALELDPENPDAHCENGRLLHALKKYDEAEAALQKSIKLDPKSGKAHVALADVYIDKKQLAKALEEFQAAVPLSAPGSPERDTAEDAARWLPVLIGKDDQVPRILNNEFSSPDSSVLLACAGLCQLRGLLYEAANYYQQGLGNNPTASDPALLPYLPRAGVTAVLAAVGKGWDGRDLFKQEQSRLRIFAVKCLDAERVALSAQLRMAPAKAKEIADTLRHREQDARLASVRGGTSLDALSDEEARQFWLAYWTNVRALREEAEAKAKGQR